MRRYQASDSPFYDREFAAQPTPRGGVPRNEPQHRAPRRYSSNISCRDCATPARIETHPSKTIYRCPACQTLLATVYPTAEVTIA